MLTLAATAVTDGEVFQQYREAPFKHFRVGQARIGHVAVDGVGAICLTSEKEMGAYEGYKRLFKMHIFCRYQI